MQQKSVCRQLSVSLPISQQLTNPNYLTQLYRGPVQITVVSMLAILMSLFIMWGTTGTARAATVLSSPQINVPLPNTINATNDMVSNGSANVGPNATIEERLDTYFFTIQNFRAGLDGSFALQSRLDEGSSRTMTKPIEGDNLSFTNDRITDWISDALDPVREERTAVLGFGNAKYVMAASYVPVTSTAPEIAVTGNGVAITDGDSSPSTTDDTDFGSSAVSSPIVHTFTVNNSGDGDLTLSTPTVGGTNASDFAVSTAPASSVAANGSTTFQITFTPSSGGTRSATLSMTNNDADENPYNFSIQGAGVPVLSIDDQTVDEGSGTMSFTVSLSVASSEQVTVDYASADSSATNGNDYTAISGTVTLAPGDTSQSITVPILEDALDENDETFVVNLSNGTNATIGDSQGVGTITDNDATPTLGIANLSANEGSGTFNFIVTLSAVNGRAVSVDYSTADSTTTSGTDYTAQNGTLTIPAGSTQGTIAVPVIDNQDAESDEVFFVNLSNPVNATLANSQGQGTILNDDIPPAVIQEPATPVPAADTPVPPADTAVPAPDTPTITPTPTSVQPVNTPVPPADTAVPLADTPTITPTPTSIQPVNTPVPAVDTPIPAVDTPIPAVDTPIPAANTPIPVVDTPIPVADTPIPVVDTPVPADTPIPAADTPIPVVDTPIPVVDTPVPADTPVPTDTPVPPTVTPFAPVGGVNLLLEEDSVIEPGNDATLVMRLADVEAGSTIFTYVVFDFNPPNFVFSGFFLQNSESGDIIFFEVPSETSAARINQEDRVVCTAASTRCALAFNELVVEQQSDIIENGVRVEITIGDNVQDGDILNPTVSLEDESFTVLTTSESELQQPESDAQVVVGVPLSEQDVPLAPVTPETPTDLSTTDEPDQQGWFSFLPFIGR